MGVIGGRILLLTITGVAVLMDLYQMKIKNSWILFSMLIGFGYDLWRGGWNGTAFFISGTGIPLVVLGWLFYFRMLGSGDIKLFCVLGGIMGPVHILWCIWYAFLTGGLLSLAILILCGGFSQRMPIVDARLENGARVNAVVRPVALNGPILTIRRFPDTPITMEKLIALGSLPAECAEFLKTLVRARYSMVIGGGTGSGKTTFLGALSNFIPSDERLITIEDNAELKIQGIENLVRLEAKMANTEGATSVTIRDLIKTALRMRPDRIVVGEVRGGEAVDMLQALICTI